MDKTKQQLTGRVIVALAILVAFFIFVWGAPNTFADDGNCSGINYFSCVTGGRAGSVAGKDGNTYYINDPSPGGICSCSGCLCVPSRDIVIRSAVGTSLDANGNVIDAGGAGGSGSGIAGGGGLAGCDSACRAAINQTYWNRFFTGFYETNPFDNAISGSVSGSVSGGGGAGAGAGGSGGAGLSNEVNILYKSIFPIRPLTEGGGPGTKTITQQEFDAKYGGYIQR